MSVRKINVRLKSVKVYDVIVSLVDVGKVLLYGWKWWKVQKERNFFIASCMFYIDSRQIRIDLNLIFMFIIRISYTNHSRLSLIRNQCVKPRTSAREFMCTSKSEWGKSVIIECVQGRIILANLFGKLQNYWSTETYLSNLASGCKNSNSEF